ncbi:MAG: hypothetical protein V7724_00855 [Sediminicola sp.]
MARIRSQFTVTGTLGEIGVYVDGRGFNGGVRINNGEFGHYSKVKSLFTTALQPLFCWHKGQEDPLRNGGIFAQVKNGMRCRAEGSVPMKQGMPLPMASLYSHPLRIRRGRILFREWQALALSSLTIFFRKIATDRLIIINMHNGFP